MLDTFWTQRQNFFATGPFDFRRYVLHKIQSLASSQRALAVGRLDQQVEKQIGKESNKVIYTL